MQDIRTLDPTELTIAQDKLAYIIVKAREYDAKVAPSEMDGDSNPVDDASLVILEDYPDDPTGLELTGALESLNDDEIVEVIALAWLGRGDFSRDEWADALALARERHNRRNAEYLEGIPNLSDCLEDGLDQLGYSGDAFARDRL